MCREGVSPCVWGDRAEGGLKLCTFTAIAASPVALLNETVDTDLPLVLPGSESQMARVDMHSAQSSSFCVVYLVTGLSSIHLPVSSVQIHGLCCLEQVGSNAVSSSC